MSAAIKFSEERLMKVLLAPVISEKATFVAEKNEQIVFKVLPDATKPEIKAAVELLFKVEVESVACPPGPDRRLPRRAARTFEDPGSRRYPGSSGLVTIGPPTA